MLGSNEWIWRVRLYEYGWVAVYKRSSYGLEQPGLPLSCVLLSTVPFHHSAISQLLWFLKAHPFVMVNGNHFGSKRESCPLPTTYLPSLMVQQERKPVWMTAIRPYGWIKSGRCEGVMAFRGDPSGWSVFRKLFRFYAACSTSSFSGTLIVIIVV